MHDSIWSSAAHFTGKVFQIIQKQNQSSLASENGPKNVQQVKKQLFKNIQKFGKENENLWC